MKGIILKTLLGILAVVFIMGSSGCDVFQGDVSEDPERIEGKIVIGGTFKSTEVETFEEIDNDFPD